MILQCKVHCWAITEQDTDQLNIEDPGAWLKAAFDLSQVKAIKQSVDEITDPLYYCTTLYFADGDSFTIDVPYDKVRTLWAQAKGIDIIEHKEELDL